MKCYFPLLILISFFAYSQSDKIETIIQKGHTAAVKSVAFSPNGKFLVTGSRDRSAKLWELESGMEMRSFLGHDLTINSVQVSSDGKWLVTSSADQMAKVWELATGKEIFTSPKQRKLVTDVALSPNNKWLVVGGYSDSAEIFEIPSGKLVKKLAVNADQGSGYGISLKFSPDGKYLAIGEDNKVARVFETAQWNEIFTFKPEEGWCGGCGTLVNFSPDSKKLIKLSHNSEAILYDLTNGKKIKSFGNEVDELSGIAIHPEGKKLLLAADKKVIEYDFSSGETISGFNFDESLGEVNKVIYHPDPNQILVAFGKNITNAYDLKSGKLTKSYAGLSNKLDKGGLNYDPDNYRESYIAKYIRLKNLLLLANNDKQFLTGKSGTHAVMWNIASGSPSKIFVGATKGIICFDMTKDGKYLVTGDGDGMAILWETASGKLLRKFEGHREPIFEVKFNKDADQIATTSWDGYLILWDVKTGERVTTLDMDNGSGYSMSYTPDGLYLVIGRLDKSLEMREPDSKEVVRKFLGHTDIVASIDFGPDPNLMLTASWDGTARIWDITTGLMVQKFKASKVALQTAIFSPDGKKVFTAGDDRKIRIYDANSAKLQTTLEGHQAEITCLKISKDGKMLVSYSLDGVIKCWNLEKGSEFYEHIHVGEKDWMAKTPNGYFSATGDARSAVHFVKGMEIFKADQFFEEFYKPYLLPELFKSKGNSGGERQFGIIEKLQQSPPPLLKLALLQSNNGLETEVYIKITDNGGGVDEIRLTHNGKILPFDNNSSDFTFKKGETKIIKKTVPLVAGTNLFAVSGFSKGRVESAISEAQVFSESAANNAKCHILAIGIDKYKNSQLTLNYAREDAEAFVQMLSQNGKGLFKEVVLHTLYDESATKNAIMDTLKSLANQVSMNDVFILFYAGHGGMYEDQFYFIPTECPRLYENNALQKSAINAQEIQDYLKSIKALKQIIIMDACHSGGAVEMIAMRGSMEEKAMAQLSRSAGIHVLASAGTEQGAKEISELQHGLFTYVLLKALSGEADGSPKDGKITIYELKSYLDDQVPELNRLQKGKVQYPYTFSRGHDFPILLK